MIAIIPARGGSKGVPNKNIRNLAGKPLIAYTIEAALKSEVFERVIVSTDSREIADVSRKYGAEVPFMRPDNIAGDSVSSDDVILHALDFFKDQKIDYFEVCKLQPTSPLRNETHICEAYELMHTQKKDFLVSICECDHSPLWCGTLGEDQCLDNFIPDEVKRACRQQLPQYYRLNGAIYMANTKAFQNNKSFLGKNSIGYIMQKENSVDIDSEIDFEFAELLLR